MQTPLPPKINDSIWTLTRKLKSKGWSKDLISDYIQQYGDIFYLDIFSRKYCIASHPEYAKHITLDENKKYIKGLKDLSKKLNIPPVGLLIVEDESLWHFHREALNKMFELDALKDYAGVIVEKTQRLMQDWKIKNRLLVPTNIDSDFVRLTIENLFYSLLFTKDIDYKFIDEMTRTLVDTILNNGKYYFFSVIPWFIFNKQNKKLKKIMAELNNLVTRMIDDAMCYKNSPIINNLMLAYKKNNSCITDEEIKNSIFSDIVIFIVTGQHTLSASLSWTFIYLAKHPHVAQSLHEEVVGTLKGRDPTFLDIMKMPYLQAVIKEVLRLQPVVPGIGRRAIEDDIITGYRIERGMFVSCSVYHIQRHPEFWANSEAFIPERFLNQPYGQSEQYAYIPFGAGPKSCIGRNFAFLEISLILATIIQKYYPVLPPNQNLNATLGIIARPFADLKMYIKAF